MWKLYFAKFIRDFRLLTIKTNFSIVLLNILKENRYKYFSSLTNHPHSRRMSIRRLSYVLTTFISFFSYSLSSTSFHFKSEFVWQYAVLITKLEMNPLYDIFNLTWSLSYSKVLISFKHTPTRFYLFVFFNNPLVISVLTGFIYLQCALIQVLSSCLFPLLLVQ